jgi:hypothetical protein
VKSSLILQINIVNFVNKNPFRSGPANLSRPKETQLPPETTARKGMCEGGTFAVPPSRLIRAQTAPLQKGMRSPPSSAPIKSTPAGGLFIGAEDGT